MARFMRAAVAATAVCAFSGVFLPDLVTVVRAEDVKLFFTTVTREQVPQSVAAVIADKQSLDGEFKPIINQFFAAANVLSTDPLVNLFARDGASARLWPLGGHVDIIEKLMAMAADLQAGKFMGCHGINSVAIVGAKGLGKTTAVSTFTYLCPAFFERVVPIYVSFESFKSGQFSSDLLPRQMANILSTHGIKVDSPATGELTLSHIRAALQQADHYMFLIVDELDQVYTMPATNDNARAVLTDLAAIASDNNARLSGRIAVAVCGSSSVLSMLINKNAAHSDVLMAEYPLLANAPHLNGSKFKDYRIHSPAMDDIEAVRTMMDSSEDLQLAPLVLFLAGANPRRVSQVPRGITNGFGFSDSLSAGLTGSRVIDSDVARLAYDAVMEVFVANNKEIIDELCNDDCSINARAVMTVSWFSKLKPVSFDDVERRVFAALKDQKTTNKSELKIELWRLHDRNWITIATASPTGPQTMFPRCMLDAVLYKYNMDDHAIKDFTLRNLNSQLKEISRNPGSFLGKVVEMVGGGRAPSKKTT